MAPIATIPKRITGKEELVVLPKVAYDNMLRLIRKKSLDSDLKAALKEYESGDFYGPFNNVEEGRGFLKAHKSRR